MVLIRRGIRKEEPDNDALTTFKAVYLHSVYSHYTESFFKMETGESQAFPWILEGS